MFFRGLFAIFLNDCLQFNLDVLKEYSISLSSKDREGINYAFLANPSLRELLDLLLEVGLEGLLLDDLNLLNEKNLEYLRVYEYLREMPTSKEGVLAILRREPEYISPDIMSDIDKNVVSNCQNDNKPTGISDIPVKSNLTYEVCGVLFSIPKVLRGFSTDDTLEEAVFQVLIRNRKLTVWDVQAIRSEIKGNPLLYS